MLHSNTTVENDVDESRNVENVSDRSKGRVLSKRKISEGAILLDETLHPHVLKCCFLCGDESDLSKLSGEEKTIGIAEGVLGVRTLMSAKEREGLDVAILVHRVIGHIHISLVDSLTLDTTEMDGLLLRIILDNLDDRESVDSKQMGVGAFPNSTDSRRAIV